MEIERRLFPRIKYPDDRRPELEVRLNGGEVKKLEVADISERGIGLIGENLSELQARSRIDAKIFFSDGNVLYVFGILLRVSFNKASIYLSEEIPTSRIKKERQLLMGPVEEKGKGEILSDEIDLNKPVVSENFNHEEVQDLLFYFKSSCEEINWWFLLYDRFEKEQEPGVDLLKKPICTELHEFANRLFSAYKKINGRIYIVNKNGLNGGLCKKLSYVRGKKEVKKWQDYLKKASNEYVTHRVTDRQGELNTLKNGLDPMGSLEWDKLKEAFNNLSKLYGKLEKWYQDPQNESLLASSDNST
jgi:hypothetical protein